MFDQNRHRPTGDVKRTIRTFAIVAFLFVLFATFSKLNGFYIDYLWFTEVGRTDVFVKILGLKFALFIFSAVLMFALVAFNISLARRISPKWQIHLDAEIIEFARAFLGKLTGVTLFGGAAVLSIMVGLGMVGAWKDVLLYLGKNPFGKDAPIFNVDLSFFLFNFPAYKILVGYLFTVLFFSAVGALLAYIAEGGVSFNPIKGRLNFSEVARNHLLVLLAVGMLIKALDHSLQAYGLLLSEQGAATGAFYTDIHANLLGLKILTALDVLAVPVILMLVLRRSVRVLVPLAGLFIAASFLLGGVIPGLVQKLIVLPNELSLERPYIARNIENTRIGFDLSAVEVQSYEAQTNLNAEKIVKNKDVVKNIRVWDWRPLLTTYSQIQEIRSYYSFNDVDVDRYNVNGDYRQLMISAREMNTGGLQENARTWVNEHLVYTHGYGIVASPVTEISKEGLPDLIVKDIPPITKTDLKIQRPEIYFGERNTDYFFVNSKEKEFDYPKGDANVFTRYEGQAGIESGGIVRKALLAWRLGDLKILLSNAVAPDSKIVLRSNIIDRVRKIAPFIAYDSDPYTVLSAGRLVWIVDGYTSSKYLPYSTRYAVRDGSINYIRNSVKVTVDAYDGTVTYYVFDDSDPLIKAYSKNFPGMFKPASAMPDDLAAHVRYPADLLNLQANVYGTYHMKDPQTFYNREDVWTIPTEIFGESPVPMEPYYTLLKMPRGEKEEFVLIMPFIISGKNNMVGWLAARMDPGHYGEVFVFRFPKDKLTFGPMQIEARIEQDPEISKQLSLWRQRGSQVIRGNLLVIPIEGSLLYVEPLYLQAEQSQLPELKKVIVSYGSTIVMEDDLQKALIALFGDGVAGVVSRDGAGKGADAGTEVPIEDEGSIDETPEQIATSDIGVSGSTPPGTSDAGSEARSDIASIAAEIETDLSKADAAQRAGDWAAYGQALDELRADIEKLKQATDKGFVN